MALSVDVNTLNTDLPCKILPRYMFVHCAEVSISTLVYLLTLACDGIYRCPLYSVCVKDQL